MADELVGGPRGAGELAGALGCDTHALYRLLRLRAALRLVELADGDRFAPATAGALTPSDFDVPMRGVVRLFAGEEQWRAWGVLEDAVRDSRPTLESLLGTPIFGWLAQKPERGRVFSEAMAARARMDCAGMISGSHYAA